MTTIVFLHAFGGSARSWDLVVSRLDSRCVVPNLRGFGGSASPPGEYDVASYVRDVLALVADLDDYVLVGHSMGGKFALGAAATRPASLRGMVLVAPSPPTPEPMAPEERRRLLEGYGDLRIATETVRDIVRRPIAEDVRESAARGYLEASKVAWSAWLEIGSLEDIADRMGAIEVPVTIVVGEGDPVVGPSVQRAEVAPRLRRCTVETVPGAGHLLPIEAPEAIVGAIDRLLRTLVV